MADAKHLNAYSAEYVQNTILADSTLIEQPQPLALTRNAELEHIVQLASGGSSYVILAHSMGALVARVGILQGRLAPLRSTLFQHTHLAGNNPPAKHEIFNERQEIKDYVRGVIAAFFTSTFPLQQSRPG